MKKLVIFGAGVRAAVVTDLIKWKLNKKFRIIGYYDDKYTKGQESKVGLPISGNITDGISDVIRNGYSVFLAMGTYASLSACNVFINCIERGFDIVNLIPSDAIISPSATFGKNCIIMPGVFVGKNVRIGNLLCAHSGVVIEHDGKIGNNVLIGPGATLAGFVVINDHSFIGAGSSIIPEVNIGTGCIIGAGSIVTKNIRSNAVAFGNPATIVRETNENDEAPSKIKISNFYSRGFLDAK